jgi:hypothetical protein
LPPNSADRVSTLVPHHDAMMSPRPQNFPNRSGRAEDSLAGLSWTDLATRDRLSDLVLRFGLDAIPERVPSVSQVAGADEFPAAGFEPAGVRLRIELDKLANPGDPS